jgi:NAD(P)-dependent dehydrogenase (short-subunit alcohol dehydrogenase family)
LGNVGTLIVTGGSRGIGAAVAKLGAARGYGIAVNYQSNEGAALAVVREIEAAGGRAIAVAGDVAKEQDVLRLFATAARELGPITALVNNAGITGKAGRVEALELQVLERVLAVNVVGAVLCAREAVRCMSTKHGGKGGAIVNIGSRASGLGGAGEWVHYGLSKGAIDTFTVGLAKEVGGEGIRVNLISPGLIDTEIHVAAGMADRLPRLAATIPIPRIGDAAEVAEGVLWLLSPAASYITGAILPISGGR